MKQVNQHGFQTEPIQEQNSSLMDVWILLCASLFFVLGFFVQVSCKTRDQLFCYEMIWKSLMVVVWIISKHIYTIAKSIEYG